GDPPRAVNGQQEGGRGARICRCASAVRTINTARAWTRYPSADRRDGRDDAAAERSAGRGEREGASAVPALPWQRPYRRRGGGEPRRAVPAPGRRGLRRPPRTGQCAADLSGGGA